MSLMQIKSFQVAVGNSLPYRMLGSSEPRFHTSLSCDPLPSIDLHSLHWM
ncbi:hypothetical protein Bca4012_077465 [Brassica carinata]